MWRLLYIAVPIAILVFWSAGTGLERVRRVGWKEVGEGVGREEREKKETENREYHCVTAGPLQGPQCLFSC